MATSVIHFPDCNADLSRPEPFDDSSALIFDFDTFTLPPLLIDANSVEHTAPPSASPSEHALAIAQVQPTGTAETPDWRVLPPEIWHHVALFACMDGGRSGCSLSAVSKEMRAIAALCRYYTLAFFSPREVLLFVEHLERAGLREIACVAMIIAPQPTPDSVFNPVTWPQRNLDEPHVVAVLTVLHAAAPTLKLLSVTWGAIGTTRVLEMVDFPALRDLVWDDGVLDPSATRGAMPALRRLHVALLIRPAALAALAPGLVELRISRVLAPDRMFEMLIIDPETSAPRHPSQRVPRLATSFRRLVICHDEGWSWARQSLMSTPAAPGTPLAEHMDALAILRRLERPVRAWAGEVLLSRKRAAVNPHMAVADHRLNWVDLLAGGCGPWISHDLPRNHTGEDILLATVV
jgi:hypothetical protein